MNSKYSIGQVLNTGSWCLIGTFHKGDWWFRHQWWYPNIGLSHKNSEETQRSQWQQLRTDTFSDKWTVATNFGRLLEHMRHRSLSWQHSIHPQNTRVITQFRQEWIFSDTLAYKRFPAQSNAATNASHHLTFDPPFNRLWTSERGPNIWNFKTWTLLGKYVDGYI